MTESQIVQYLVARRKQLGISQAQAAREMGITRQGLRHIEKELGSPYLYNIIKYMEVVGLDLRMEIL